MDAAEFDVIVYRIDGYIDALASITKGFRHYNAYARSAELDITKIDESITTLFSGYCSGLKNDFPDLDVPSYSFKKAITIKNWIRTLHKELEIYLLPEEYTKSITEPDALKSIQYNLAWQVMEMVRMVTNEFESEEIYKANYEVSNSRKGVLFVIPAGNACLTLNFESGNDV